MIFELIESTADSLIISISNLLIPAIIFFLLSFLIKGKSIGMAIYKSFSSGAFNILLMSLNVIMVSPVILLISQLMASQGLYNIDIVSWDVAPEFFVIVSAVFCGDFIGYWRHRFEHSRYLWPTHIVHHSDTQMTWLTLQRIHPLNRLSTFFIDTSFLLVLGFPPYAIIANNLIRHYYGYFIHADLPWTYGKWGNFFVSPVMHRWHHAADVSAHNTNFATIFSIFDRCFGTYRVPEQCKVALGVSYFLDKGLLKNLLYPFRPKSYYKNLNKLNNKI